MTTTDYDYRVTTINTAITQSDLSKGLAESKVAAQVEQTLKALNREGYEYYNTFPVGVQVRPGCLGGGVKSLSMLVMVFRRAVM